MGTDRGPQARLGPDGGLPGLEGAAGGGNGAIIAIETLARGASPMTRSDRGAIGERVLPDAVSLDLRSRILDQAVRDEVTDGARIEHRDMVSAVLARGSQRALVRVDEAGVIHVDRLAGPRPRRLTFLLLIAVALAALVLAIGLGPILGSPG